MTRKWLTDKIEEATKTFGKLPEILFFDRLTSLDLISFRPKKTENEESVNGIMNVNEITGIPSVHLLTNNRFVKMGCPSKSNELLEFDPTQDDS